MEEKTSLLNVIEARRSTRRFKEDPVSDEDLNAVLEAARWAASGSNKQPWKFIIIKNKETMQQIVEAIPYKDFQKFLENAPVLLVALADTKKSRWWMLDVTLAVANLMLEAWARGLGTCFSAWYPTAPESLLQTIKAMLEIPDKWTIITMTPIGYPVDPPEEAFHVPATRKPLEEIVCYEKFSE